MHNLTAEERSTISRYLADPRGRTEIFLQCAIYFVPSLLFGLYGLWEGDLGALVVAYVVLLGLVAYLIQRQLRANPLFRSAIRKLVDNCGALRQAD